MNERILIADSPEFPGDESTRRYRYVLYLLNDGLTRKWVTWAQGFPGGDFFLGHYFDNEAEAWVDFGQRCQQVCMDISNLIRRREPEWEQSTKT